MIDFIREVAEKTAISRNRLIKWFDIDASQYYNWKKRYGKSNSHNGWIPRDWWLTELEKQAIIAYYINHPLEGYRRLTYMMIDEGVVAVSPATVYRVLCKENLIGKRSVTPSKKGTGFEQPLKAHEHWHVDISYINIDGTFYYLCIVIDGYSRFIVHWELRESMKEIDIEVILQRAKELYPEARPRIITDNGPQFISKDFKEFIRLSGMTHVRTSPYYPQSNGKSERVQKTVKYATIRKRSPKDVEDGRDSIGSYIEYYNNRRLHSAISYISPRDKLMGREKEILRERERKLLEAREARRRINRSVAAA